MTCQWRDNTRALSLALCVWLAGSAAGQAYAADLFDTTWLRGSLSSEPVRWDGIVMGAHVGYSAMNSDFGNSTSSQVAFVLRNSSLEDQFHPENWTTLPNKTTQSMSWGAFLGYNFQVESALVLGVDITYTRPSDLEASATDSLQRSVTLSDGTNDNVSITASSSVKLIDYASVRARLGYAFGQFLPYGILGVAVGRFDYVNQSQVTVVQTPSGGAPTTFVFPTQTDSRSNAFAPGFAYGLGVDIAVTPTVFVRGEWEYVAFGEVGGIRSTVNTARAGIGLRF